MTCRSRAAQFARWNKVRRETGYRCQYEADVAAGLAADGVETSYEALRIPYVVNICAAYKPDWALHEQAIMLEVKGEFRKEDRDKMLLVKQQHPHLDIRLMFQRPGGKVTQKLTYAMWAEKNGFPWCQGPRLPDDWRRHKPGVLSRMAFAAAVTRSSPPA